MIAIYILKDPRDFRLRYVGKSKCPKNRYRRHLCDPCSEGMKKWILQLRDAGLKPVMEIIEWCSTQWQERERFWIQHHRQAFDLLNVLDGGDGGEFVSFSESAISKMKAAQKGRVISAETRAKMRLSHKGRPHTPESRARLSAARKGMKCHPPSAETRAKISAAMLGLTRSEETRKKMTAAKKSARLALITSA